MKNWMSKHTNQQKNSKCGHNSSSYLQNSNQHKMCLSTEHEIDQLSKYINYTQQRF